MKKDNNNVVMVEWINNDARVLSNCEDDNDEDNFNTSISMML